MKCIQKLTHLKGVPNLSMLSVLLTSIMTTIHSHITHINSFLEILTKQFSMHCYHY